MPQPLLTDSRTRSRIDINQHWSVKWFVFALVVSLGSLASDPVHAQDTTAKPKPMPIKATPYWIWGPNSSRNESVSLRREFTVDGEIKRAMLAATADNHCKVQINGNDVVSSDDWADFVSADVSKAIVTGKNVISVTAQNDGGIEGFIAYLQIESGDKAIELVSDGSWKVSNSPAGDWKSIGFDDSAWQAPRVIAAMGDSNLPWSSINRDSLQASLGGQGAEFFPQIAENAKVPEGFKIEKIYQVPRSMGSWVALTTDAQGRLIASDQGGAGLFRITPGTESEPTKVEKLPVALSGAQGLVWAFDSLYAVVNGGDKSGLHRLTDTDGDGMVDKDEHCMFLPGGGEHGPHAVILSPDGKSLFVASGNHTKLPNEVAGSKIPQNWNEDHILPRRWDANGHAAGILAPGGWICNVDPSGKEWTVFSMGYRNQYDIAFNSDGELFTYDADMEWDFGSPWYRPTRVCHATSGSEFGWRSGTGKWPQYYEDSLPPVVDIGPGSPTGIVFGHGAKFPARYQRALFILDWTYSTIYAIDMEAEGSSYRGTKSDFVTGSPLPVTDAIVGHDGALYFAAGGRGTQSSLYRVTYVGNESTAPVEVKSDEVNSPEGNLRKLRHQLEAFHGKPAGDIDFMVANLGHEDRFVRYAARIALESQPIANWKDRVFGLQASAPRAVMNGMLAVARQGSEKDVDRLVEKLSSLEYDALSEHEKLMWLRTLQVAFARHGAPSAAWRQKLVSQLDAVYPSDTYPLNAELVQLLVYLESPTVVAKTIKLMGELGPEPIPEWGYLVERNAGYGGTVGKMLADMPPVRGIHFAFVLRNAKTGWTIADRTKYFEFFVKAVQHPGGNSFGKFLTQFRDDALATCSTEEKIVLATITDKPLITDPFKSTPPKGPGRKWTKAEAMSVLEGGIAKRNFESGRNLYHATSCSKCHRMSGDGGAIGPDLSTAGKKFSVSDMLDSIIEPSKAISDQYGSQQVITTSGQVLIGRVVEIDNQFYVYTADADAKPIVLSEDDVDEIQPSPVSQMPTGLIDTLSADELKDLMAFLMAAGDPNADLYK